MNFLGNGNHEYMDFNKMNSRYDYQDISNLLPPSFVEDVSGEYIFNSDVAIPIDRSKDLNMSSLYTIMESNRIRKIVSSFECRSFAMGGSVESGYYPINNRTINIVGKLKRDGVNVSRLIYEMEGISTKWVDSKEEYLRYMEESIDTRFHGLVLLCDRLISPISALDYDNYINKLNSVNRHTFCNIIVSLINSNNINHDIIKPFVVEENKIHMNDTEVRSYGIYIEYGAESNVIKPMHHLVTIPTIVLESLKQIFDTFSKENQNKFIEILSKPNALSFTHDGNLYLGSAYLANLLSAGFERVVRSKVTDTSCKYADTSITFGAATISPNGEVKPTIMDTLTPDVAKVVCSEHIVYGNFKINYEDTLLIKQLMSSLISSRKLTSTMHGIPTYPSPMNCQARGYAASGVPYYDVNASSFESINPSDLRFKDMDVQFGYPTNGLHLFKQPEEQPAPFGIFMGQKPNSPQPGSYAKQHLFNPYDSTDMNNWAAMNPHYPSGNISAHKSLANDLSNLTSRQEFVLTLKVTTDKCCQCIKLNDNTKSIIETLHLEKDELGGYRLKIRLTGNPNDVVIYDSELSNDDILTVYEMLSVIMNYGTLNVGLPSVLANTGKYNNRMYVKNNGYGYNVEINLGK